MRFTFNCAFSFIVAASTFLIGDRSAQAETIYGLTNLQQLVAFDSTTRTVTSTTSLSSFSLTGPFLVSIDVRPATSELYGIANNKQIYSINPLTGASTAIGSPLVTGGAIRAIDFNPTVDRIRVITSTDENLRAAPTTAIAGSNNLLVGTDTPIAFNAADANAGDNPDIANFAYTNSFAGATSTTLFDLEVGNDVFADQTPANGGTLNTRGSLGFNVVSSSGFTGFDISGATSTAYLTGNSLLGGGLAVNSLYTVSLTTGAATLAGAITGINGTLRDIAVAPAAAVPEPSTVALLVIGAIGCCGMRRRSRRNSRAC